MSRKKVIIAVCLFILSMCFTKEVDAASKFKIKLDSDDKVLTKYNGKESVVRVPEGVTIINGAFKNNKYVKKIILSESVVDIYDGSFYNLKNLKKVIFSKNVRNIEKGAFYKCPKIRNIMLNKKCKYVGEWAFSGCDNLRKITVEKGNKYLRVYKGALFNREKTKLLCYPKKCNKNKTFVIPKSVKSVSSTAFKDNCYIEKLIIKADCSDGGYDIKTFTGMKRLKEVVFVSKQTKDCISFMNCKKLQKVVLAEGTKKIGYKQFAGCVNLATINLPDSLESISDNAFEGCDKLVLPEIDETKIKHMEY